MTSGGFNSAQTLPASDNFLIFLNNTLQIKGTNDAYTYTGSEITFSEAPLAGMDFFGYYFGKLTKLDQIEPFFDNKCISIQCIGFAKINILSSPRFSA